MRPLTRKILRPFLHRKKNAGFSLYEMVIVFGISGFVIFGSWIAFSQLQFNNRVKAGSQQLLTISQNVRVLYVDKGVITGTPATLTPALDKLKVFPLEMRQNANNPAGIIFNPWNNAVAGGLGSVTVTSAGFPLAECSLGPIAPNSNACFSVSYANVPRAACIPLIIRTSENYMNGLIRISNTANGNVLTVFPVTPSAAQAFCTLNNITIFWTYALKERTL